MKRIIALTLVLVMAVFALASCGNPAANKSEGVMYYKDYIAADENTEVVIEAFVQATQSWWDNKITVYLADLDGAYFAYELACSEEDAAKLVPGTKIKITGYKTSYAGEIEIDKGATFEFGDKVTYIAPAKDMTANFGNDEELIKYQNQLATFKGVTVKSVEYQNGQPGKDIYVAVTLGDKEMNFCVESYLTAPDSEVYTTVGALAEGDVVDLEGYIYWYNGANPHIVKVVKK